MGRKQVTPQEAFLRECRSMKAALEAQADILHPDPKTLGANQLGAVSRKLAQLTVQMDKIITLGLRMVATQPNSTVVARNPPFWKKEPNAPPVSIPRSILQYAAHN